MQMRRGFHRIGMSGLVTAAAIAVVSIAFAIYWWTGGFPMNGDSSFGLGIMAIVTGGLWYLASWALGWIIAGFRND
jgi:hypothetical protein